MQIHTFEAFLATLQPGQRIRVSGFMYDTRVTPLGIVGTDLVTKGTPEAPTELIDITGIMRCGASPIEKPYQKGDWVQPEAATEDDEIEGGQE